MKQDYTQQVEAVIRFLGGAGNILSVTNCMTRLRVVVKDAAAVDEEKLRAQEDVMGVVHDRERYIEIVVGPGKSRKYADLCHEMGLPAAAPGEAGSAGALGSAGMPGPAGMPGSAGTPDAGWRSYRDEVRSRQKGSRIRSGLKVIGDIFVPLLPGIIAAGLCAGAASMITQAVPDLAGSRGWSMLWQLLSLISSSFMTYLTAWAGYRAAERFGATPVLGGMLGMITSLDGINQLSLLLGLYNEQNPLDSVLRAGKGGVLAVMIGVYLLAKVEKKIRSQMPESLDIVFTPLLTLLICVIPYILVIMPLFGFVSGGIVRALGRLCLSESVLVRIIAGYISTAVFLPLVAAGMHHGMVALYSVQLQELGYVTLYPALAMAGAGQVGTAIALWIKAKRVGNRKLCSVISGALPAGFLGIGEPLIYGVTLPLGKPSITAGLGAGFGGALVMAFQVAATAWGPSGLLGVFVMTAGPLGAGKSMLIYLAGLIVSYVCSFLITSAVFDKRELIPEDEQAGSGQALSRQAAGAGEERSVRRGDPIMAEDAPGDPGTEDGQPAGTAENAGTRIGAPADGVLVPRAEIPDPAFAFGTMWQCTGIMPENGKIYAPCDGVVTSVAVTKHAMVFTRTDGREILVHVGIDTVGLDGRGFTIFAAEGTAVSEGDLVMEADLDVIREAGLSPIVIAAVT